MKPIAGLLLFAIVSFVAAFSTASAQAGGWYLEVRNVTLTTVDPVTVAIDPGDGSGFGFLTLRDDDGDGVIQLPLVPNGGGVALGTVYVGCDIWDFTGTSMSGATRGEFRHPLLIVAEEVEGHRLRAVGAVRWRQWVERVGISYAASEKSWLACSPLSRHSE